MLPLFLANDIALAIGGDKVWFAKGKDGQVVSWRYQRAMELAAKAKRRDAAVASLCLAGSYSRVPGITDLVAKAFQCRVVVPEHPEEAMVRGCQRVLADLKFLLPHFGSKP
jgi:hypothetical protein